jgi:hypothetical protein
MICIHLNKNVVRKTESHCCKTSYRLPFINKFSTWFLLITHEPACTTYIGVLASLFICETNMLRVSHHCFPCIEERKSFFFAFTTIVENTLMTFILSLSNKKNFIEKRITVIMKLFNKSGLKKD